jgi:hypothetical protein
MIARSVLGLIGLLALFLSAAFVPGVRPVAEAVGCGTAWAAPVDGFWGDATKWTGGIPNNNGACITVDGTYTVTVGITPNNIDYLILGGNSGVQTLQIDGGIIGTSLSVNNGTGVASTINANGRLVLTNLTNNNGAAVFHAPSSGDYSIRRLENGGIISVIDGSAGTTAQRYLTGNIVNTGTINIHRDTTMDTSSTTWDNQGVIDLGTGDTLTFADTSCGGCRPTFVNGTNGSITGSGTLQMNGSIHANNGFFWGAGTINAASHVILDNASLHMTGSGAGKITMHNTLNDMTGNLGAGQEIAIESVDNGSPIDARLTIDQDTTSAGTVRLTHAGTGTSGASIFQAALFGAQTWTTSGSIISEDGTGGSSSTRQIWGNIANSGTITIDRDTTVNRSSSIWTNTGTVTIASGKTLTFADTGCGGCRPTFVNNTNGTITGSGKLFLDNIRHSTNGFFNGGGTINAASTVLLNSSSLHYTGTGAGKITVHGNQNELTGDMSAGQELVIEAVDDGTVVDAKITYDQSMVGAGTVRLTHAGTGTGGDATLSANGGGPSFSNSGSIISEDGTGGSTSTRHIYGHVANSGTVTINRDTTIDRFASTWTNTGTVTIAAGKTLAFSTGGGGGVDPTFVNNTGGSVTGSGSLTFNNIRHTNNGYFQGDGTINAATTVVLHSTSLHLTGAGAAKFYLHGIQNDLTGTIRSGQELVVERANGEDALISSDTAVDNQGTITLNAGAGSATVKLVFGGSDGVLSNSGTIRGTGTLQATSVTNSGTFAPGASAGTLTLTGTYDQTSSGTLAIEIGGPTAGTQHDRLAITGAANLAGTLAVTPIADYVPGSSEIYTVLTHASRSGTFTTLNGTIINGKSLTPSYGATTTSLAVGCLMAPFSDVPTSNPFCAEMKWMKDAGISSGFGDGTYRPGDSVTRQAMSAFMARLAGAVLTPCSTPPFSDVPTTNAFCKEIKWVKESNISTGFGDGTFHPGDAVTRQAMSAFMARLAGATPSPCPSAPFSDVPTSHPFCKEIQWMRDNGISTGFGDGTYKPANVVTRQAMSAFMSRVAAILD